jgi:hypothetical protein
MTSNSVALLADAGVPMIFLTFPAMLALLLPIVAVEAWLCRKWLGLDTWAAIKANAAANAASTLIGVPLAWGVMLVLELIIGWGISRSPGVERTLDKVPSPVGDVLGVLLSSAWLGP